MGRLPSAHETASDAPFANRIVERGLLNMGIACVDPHNAFDTHHSARSNQHVNHLCSPINFDVGRCLEVGVNVLAARDAFATWTGL